MITKNFIIFVALLSLNLYSNIYTVYHTVKKGENLSLIAKKYGKTPEELKKLNNLKNTTIYPGQKIIIEKKEKQYSLEKNKTNYETKTNLVAQSYTVQKGDNLYKISKKFGISVAQLKKMNNLKSSTIHPGQKIIIGYKNIESEKSVKKEINPDEIQSIVDVSKKIYYKVLEGDTIESIGEKFGIEPDKLLQANLLKREDLKAGQIIVIPPKDILDQDIRKETVIENKSNVRIKLIEEVFNYLGSRYVYGGESKFGLDCSGLTRLVYKTVGILLPQNSSLQYKNGIEIKKEEALPGDLVFFKRGNQVGHVGIYLGNDLFVHASYTLKRVVISSLSERYFKERFVGFRRYLIDDDNTYFAEGIGNVKQE
ncbi:MAG: LysM peptidoglycan-binding domain-containing protein [Candidatus Ratteibacteria bacterium]